MNSYHWDDFYEEWWEDHPDGEEPTYEDFADWLYDRADLALGEG